jgi:hypothetical protein
VKLLISFVLSVGASSAWASYQCSEPPAFTQDQVLKLNDWAVGGAFRQFAGNAGAVFNYDSYRADCPNWAAFGYGIYNGAQCTAGVDVLSSYFGELTALAVKLSNDPDGFKDYYWAEAKNVGMDKYLTPAQEQLQPDVVARDYSAN